MSSFHDRKNSHKNSHKLLPNVAIWVPDVAIWNKRKTPQTLENTGFSRICGAFRIAERMGFEPMRFFDFLAWLTGFSCE
jgi:hypothetical protein